MEIAWHPGDEVLSEFIRTYIDSFCTWDVLVFLAHNPAAVETARGLAARVGRGPEDVEACLETLAEKGILEAASAFDETIYRLAPCEDRLAVLVRFANTQSDPVVRTEALRRIMDVQKGDAG